MDALWKLTEGQLRDWMRGLLGAGPNGDLREAAAATEVEVSTVDDTWSYAHTIGADGDVEDRVVRQGILGMQVLLVVAALQVPAHQATTARPRPEHGLAHDHVADFAFRMATDDVDDFHCSHGSILEVEVVAVMFIR